MERRYEKPSSVLEFQRDLGPDIAMVLDHCPPGDAPREETEASLRKEENEVLRRSSNRG